MQPFSVFVFLCCEWKKYLLNHLSLKRKKSFTFLNSCSNFGVSLDFMKIKLIKINLNSVHLAWLRENSSDKSIWTNGNVELKSHKMKAVENDLVSLFCLRFDSFNLSFYSYFLSICIPVMLYVLCTSYLI